MRGTPLLLLLLGAAWVLGPGCAKTQDAAPQARVSMTVEPSPPQVGPAAVTLELTESGEPLRGAAVEIEGNMNHAGMVPVFADARETGPGTYRAQIELTMAGDWFLLVNATLADGRSFERKVDLPGVRPK